MKCLNFAFTRPHTGNFRKFQVKIYSSVQQCTHMDINEQNYLLVKNSNDKYTVLHVFKTYNSRIYFDIVEDNGLDFSTYNRQITLEELNKYEVEILPDLEAYHTSHNLLD